MSWWLFIYSVAIPAYAPFARKLMKILPHKVFLFYLASLLFLFVYIFIFTRGKTIPMLLSLPVFFMTGYLIFPLNLIEEKVHILEFMLLGLLAGKDKKLKIHPLTLVVIVAIIDEGYQHLIPGRFFDIRDIGMDIAGGFLGWVLSLISDKFAKSN